MRDQVHAGTAAALEEAGWPLVRDHLLEGIGEDLGNRVATLLNLVRLLQLDEEARSLGPFLEKEVTQLERVVALLRAVPGESGGAPESIHLPDFLPPLVELQGLQRGLEGVARRLEVDQDGTIPAALAPWNDLARCVLVFLSAASRESLARDRYLVLRLGARNGEGTLEAVLPGVRRGGLRPPETGRLAGMRGLAESLGGAFRQDDGPAELRLNLAFPARVRR